MKSATTLTINACKKRSAYGASHRDTNISPEAAEPDPFIPSVYRIQRYVVICATIIGTGLGSKTVWIPPHRIPGGARVALKQRSLGSNAMFDRMLLRILSLALPAMSGA